MNTRELLKFIKNDAKEYRIKLFFGKCKNVKIPRSNIRSSGFFSEVDRLLAVATGVPENVWIPILLHEYCHMQQSKEQLDIWKNDRSEDLDYWLDGKVEKTTQEIEDMVFSTLNIELDCEKRVIEFIKRHNIDIDVEVYAKKSNAYVYFYHIIKNHRKWYNTDRKPYNIEAVWSKMPSHFENDYSTIPLHYEALLLTCC